MGTYGSQVVWELKEKRNDHLIKPWYNMFSVYKQSKSRKVTTLKKEVWRVDFGETQLWVRCGEITC